MQATKANGHPAASLKALFMKSLDYTVPEFGGLWEPDMTYLPNGWGVAIAEIGPAVAQAMLDTNREDNRNRRNKVASRYADDIRCGRWELTHQGIAFDRKGRLCDGQHRLTGCVESGSAFRTLVFFGVGSNAEMSVLDTGANRTAADASTYLLGERVSHDAIAAVRGFIYGTSRYRSPLTHSHLLQQIDRYSAAVSFHAAVFCGNNCKRPQAPARAAVLRAYYHGDRSDLIRFSSLLMERIDPSEPRDRAAKMLRHYLSDGPGRGIDGQREMYCKAQRAISAYFGGEPISRLYACEEDLYPLPSDAQIADRNALEESLTPAG